VFSIRTPAANAAFDRTSASSRDDLEQWHGELSNTSFETDNDLTKTPDSHRPLRAGPLGTGVLGDEGENRAEGLGEVWTKYRCHSAEHVGRIGDEGSFVL
jgi:hypothetical protein